MSRGNEAMNVEPVAWNLLNNKTTREQARLRDERDRVEGIPTWVIKNLKYYKDIGTRLLQIAQKRSIELGFDGNIELIAKEESKPFYLNVINMEEKYPIGSFERKYNNPNKLFLPNNAKEHLSKLQGGL